MELGIAGYEDDDFFSGGFEVPTVKSILKFLGSGLGLDVSKNHTGVCIYRDGEINQVGFKLDEYQVGNTHAEYLMRKDFKLKLKNIVGGMKFDYCVIEDVYGGENFDTVRKLLALQTVIDELIDEGTVEVVNFYRWSEAKWMSNFRKAYIGRKGLKVKYETQAILEYLQDDFYLANKDLKNADKMKIFFEDICDATGMLCGLSLYLQNYDEEAENKKKIKIKDVKMFYIEDETFYLETGDERVVTEAWVWQEPKYRVLEHKILEALENEPELVHAMEVPVIKLGKFGIDHHFKFYSSGQGVLIWYLKQK